MVHIIVVAVHPLPDLLQPESLGYGFMAVITCCIIAPIVSGLMDSSNLAFVEKALLLSCSYYNITAHTSTVIEQHKESFQCQFLKKLL